MFFGHNAFVKETVSAQQKTIVQTEDIFRIHRTSDIEKVELDIQYGLTNFALADLYVC